MQSAERVDYLASGLLPGALSLLETLERLGLVRTGQKRPTGHVERL